MQIKRNDSEQEVRRASGDTTFWVRRAGLFLEQWVLTANGTVIWGPGDRAEAIRQLEALTYAANQGLDGVCTECGGNIYGRQSGYDCDCG